MHPTITRELALQRHDHLRQEATLARGGDFSKPASSRRWRLRLPLRRPRPLAPAAAPAASHALEC